MYLYAVQYLNIQTITHKYLIRGHTQNEGDTIHSIIEKSLTRAKKSGPIYVPDQYLPIIRNAKKKGEPLHVREMHFSDFKDIKTLHNDMALTMTKDVSGNDFKLSEIKVVRFEKGREVFFLKNNYKQLEWNELNFTSKKTRARKSIETNNIILKSAYTKMMTLSENKLRDLMSLIQTNIIPQYYKTFYETLENK